MVIPRIYRRLVDRLEALLRRGPETRQTRLYCVGAPRTGTHTIAALFDHSVRSAHEPGLRALMRQVLAHHRGELSFDDLRRFVRRRDAQLTLDVDSSHLNAWLIDALLAEFDDARFVLTIRDCYSWIDSAINHTLNSRRWSKAAGDFVDFWFGRQHRDHSPQDAFLQQHGLLSIDCYLAAWRRHNERVLAAVPTERLLVVRTDAISQRLHDIAAFAGIAAEHLVPAVGVRGRAKATHGMLQRVDATYLADRVAVHCEPLMSRFFPDVRSLHEATTNAGRHD